MNEDYSGTPIDCSNCLNCAVDDDSAELHNFNICNDQMMTFQIHSRVSRCDCIVLLRLLRLPPASYDIHVTVIGDAENGLFLDAYVYALYVSTFFITGKILR